MNILTIAFSSLAALFLLISIGLLFSRSAIKAQNKKLLDKLTQIEVEFLSLKDDTQPQEKKTSSKEDSSPSTTSPRSSSDILDLKKEIAKLKNDFKKSKEEIRQKEKQIKDEETNSNNKLYTLTEENTQLIQQLKDMDQQLKTLNNTVKTSVTINEFESKISENNSLKEELNNIKTKSLDYEKQQKSNISKVISLQEKLKIAEVEIKKWTVQSIDVQGETLDPASLIKWKERALTGRKMYKLTRQLRDLTDHKLQTYQEAVIAISEWVLEQKGFKDPVIQSGEIRSDRLLAEAWSLILSEKNIAGRNQQIDSVSSILS